MNRQSKAEEEPSTEESNTAFEPLKSLTERHHPYLVQTIATEAGVTPSDIVDFEMLLYDTQKACIGGLNEELIYSARLDNLEMSYCSAVALVNAVQSPSALDGESSIRLISLFDDEEIGSMTAQGAHSNHLPALVRRLSILPSAAGFSPDSDNSYDTMFREAELGTAYEQTVASSFLISADMAHSVNPNYAGKYEADHRPEMNKGPVLKVNANSKYATNSPGIVLLQEIARRRSVPLQMFVIRNDSSCGSTIGPMLSAAMGTRTLDLGNPQMSMHSIRETGGVYDVDHAIRLFEGFFEHFSELESKIFVD